MARYEGSEQRGSETATFGTRDAVIKVRFFERASHMRDSHVQSGHSRVGVTS